MRIRKMTIVSVHKPAQRNINSDLQWLGSALGLFGLRDKDKSCFRIFVELVKASKHQRFLSSDELAYILGLTRGTVIHHINRLQGAGIVISENRKYGLRDETLEGLVDRIEKDVVRACDDIKKVAKDIDKMV